MTRRSQLALGVGGVVVLLTVGAVFLGLRRAASELGRLDSLTVYASPEAALRDLGPRYYPVACRLVPRIDERDVVDGVRLGYIRVLPPGPRGCAPDLDTGWYGDRGFYFFRVRLGWVYLPQERYPPLTIAGKWVFDHLSQ